MTQEEKELLLKDLCARLPYGVKIACGQYDKNPRNVNSISIVDIGTFLNGYFNKGIHFDFNDNKELWPKPYLRPMSSMTEEEEKEFCKIEERLNFPCKHIKLTFSVDEFDWLNAHHFDYRGLIEKGLALEAPEGMYNLKDE